MQRLLLSLCLLFSAWTVSLAQPICMPDSTAIDTFISGFGVNPLPYDLDLNPTGGFQDTACIDSYFETVVQVAIGDTANFAGNSFPLDSLILLDIVNLPTGMTYECSAPNCTVFANEFVCATIYGTPVNTDDIGDNILQIQAQIFSGGFSFVVNYPDDLNVDGQYSLVVKSVADCVVSTNDLGDRLTDLHAEPNPTTGRTDIVFETSDQGRVALTVTSLLGTEMSRTVHGLQNGTNRLPVDATDWPAGVYLYTLRQGSALTTGRLVVSR